MRGSKTWLHRTKANIQPPEDRLPVIGFLDLLRL
jgi:hypothetical protein